MADPGTAWFSISKWKSGVKCENSIMELKLSDTIEDVVSRVHGNVSSEEISNVWVGHTSDTERVVVTLSCLWACFADSSKSAILC